MYRKMQNGTFPRNIKISTRCTGWRESAVTEWLKNPIFIRPTIPSPADDNAAASS
jgi:prophage regulatory protein